MHDCIYVHLRIQSVAANAQYVVKASIVGRGCPIQQAARFNRTIYIRKAYVSGNVYSKVLVIRYSKQIL